MKNQKRTIGRTVIRWSKWALVCIILSILLLYTLIRQTSVQQYIAEKITSAISDKLQTTISIGTINLEFFDLVSLQDIYIQDLSGDTLAYANFIRADIGFFSLINKKILIEQITSKGLVLNLNEQTDSTYNYSFIVTSLSSKDQKPANSSAASEWDIQLNSIISDGFRFNLNELSGNKLTAEGGKLAVRIESYNLLLKNIELQSVTLENTRINYFSEQLTLQSDAQETPHLIELIPSIDWSLNSESIIGNNNSIIYISGENKRLKGSMDFNYLEISNFNVAINDLNINDNILDAEIKHLQLIEASGFEVEQLAMKIKLKPQQLYLSELILKTPFSFVNSDLAFELTESSINPVGDFTIESHFSNSFVGIQDLALTIPNISTYLNTDLRERINIKGTVKASKSHLHLENIELNTGKLIDLQGNLLVTNIDQPNNVGYLFDLSKVQSSYTSLKTLIRNLPLPKELEYLDELTIIAKGKGNHNALQIQNLVINSSNESNFELKGNIKNITDFRRLLLDIEISRLFVNLDHMIPQFGDSTLMILQSLGNLTYEGTLKGNLESFLTKGSATTSIGKITSNLQIGLDQNYSLKNYKGSIILEKFYSGKLMKIPELGKVSMDMHIEGSGIALQTMDAELVFKISEFTYNEIDYDQIWYEGTIHKGIVAGQLNIDNELINGRLNGMVDFSRTTPRTIISAEIKKLNLKDFNLTDKNLNLEFVSKLDIIGFDVDSIIGNVSIEQFHLFNESNSYRTNDILLTAQHRPNDQKHYQITSEFADASIQGQITWAHIPVILENQLIQIFPSISMDTAPNLTAPLEKSKVSDDSFQIEVTLKDYKPIALWGISELPEAKDAHFNLSWNGPKDNISITGHVSNFLFKDLSIDNISIESIEIDQAVATNVQFENSFYKTNHIPFASLNSRIKNNENSFSLDLSRDSMYQFLQLSGRLSKLGEENQLSFNESIVINNESWSIPIENDVSWNSETLIIKEFMIQKNGKSISIQGNLNFDGSISNENLAIEFSEFPVANITHMMEGEIGDFTGSVNGIIFIKDNLSNPALDGDLLISQLSIDDYILGDLLINAQHQPGSQLQSIKTSLTSPDNLVELKGTVNKTTGVLALDTHIEKLALASIDPFVQEIFKDSKGILKGKLHISGTPLLPMIEGEISLHNIETNVEYAKTRYFIDDQLISFRENEIDFDRLKVFDGEKGHLFVNGKIRHTRYQDFIFDLSIASDNFKFLNTSAQDNELYYGKLYLWAEGTIKGPIEVPEVNLAARTLSNTALYISAFSSLDQEYDDDFVIFSTPQQFTIKENRPVQKKNDFPLFLRLNLELTDEAKFEFIIDPGSGDKLKCQGQSNLTVTANPTGNFEVYGQYLLSKGQYDFSYSEFVKRQFDIQKGSTVNFNGDLTKTTFNASAIYNTQTSIYELIKNETTLSSSEILIARRKTPVDVSLAISGQLQSPEINFDIKLPESVAGSVGDMVDEKLQNLRRNPNEMNNQVFGLLLVNSFMLSAGTSESSGAGLGRAGAAQGLSSVSSLFTTQLNQLAQKHIKGVEVNFDIDAYQTDKNADVSSSLVTKVGVGVSKQLLGDRLKIQATGNLDIEEVDQNNTYTSIAGNFLLEYKLTENGQYILRVYRRDTNNSITGEKSTKNGVGIMFKKTFDDRRN